jgi:hypothetical protein
MSKEKAPIDNTGKVHYEQEVEGKRIGKAPAKSHPLMLNFSNYAKADIIIPEKTSFWKNRTAFPIRHYGNTMYGDCTKASQAILATRMERIESRITIMITDEEIINNYLAMSQRLYGGGDNGAYEIDALSEWRKKDLTFRDVKGNPLTIDAFTRVNHGSIAEVKKAIFLGGAHGIKVCFNLPAAWQRTLTWDIPVGQQPVGIYLPGTWGGHSMAAVRDYDKDWLYLDHTWNTPAGKISWRAFSIYCDEAYSVVDSISAWRKRLSNKEMNISKLVSDVNVVSSTKIK